MVIRNIALGGTSDWALNEHIKSQDLNDTFTAAATKIKSLSTFWVNSYLSEKYDDYSTYSLDDDITDGTDYDVDISIVNPSFATGYVKIKEHIFDVGTERVIQLNSTANQAAAGSSSVVTVIPNLPINCHYFAKVYFYAKSQWGLSRAGVYFDGTGADSFILEQSGNSTLTDSHTIMVLAKGTGEYDCYVDGFKITTVTANFALRLLAQTNGGNTTGDQIAYLRISEIIQSQEAVQ